MVTRMVSSMTSHTVAVVYVGCFVLALFLGILRGYIRQQTRKMRDEQRELLRWQIELEKKASEIREKSR